MRNNEIISTEENKGIIGDDFISHKIKDDAERLATLLYCLYKERRQSYNKRGQNS